MEKRLELQFLTEEGKGSTLAITNPAADLSETSIKSAMETIVDQKLFESNGVQRYNGIRGARYVTREVEEVFSEDLV